MFHIKLSSVFDILIQVKPENFPLHGNTFSVSYHQFSRIPPTSRIFSVSLKVRPDRAQLQINYL